MADVDSRNRKLLVGMHDGVCAIRSSDGGKTWNQGSVTPLAHAAARLTVSAAAPQWVHLDVLLNAEPSQPPRDGRRPIH